MVANWVRRHMQNFEMNERVSNEQQLELCRELDFTFFNFDVFFKFRIDSLDVV